MKCERCGSEAAKVWMHVARRVRGGPMPGLNLLVQICTNENCELHDDKAALEAALEPIRRRNKIEIMHGKN